MMDLKYYSSFDSRIHYYDLTDELSQIFLLTEESDFIIWGRIKSK
jgi:hypothetical protein